MKGSMKITGSVYNDTYSYAEFHEMNKNNKK